MHEFAFSLIAVQGAMATLNHSAHHAANLLLPLSLKVATAEQNGLVYSPSSS